MEITPSFSPDQPQNVSKPSEEQIRSKPKKEKKKRESRGVETMFRTTITNHLKLSEMADQKANLMISINAIIISITVSSYFGKAESNANLLIPTLALLFVSLITIIVALIATNPVVKSKKTGTATIDDTKRDLLFFGDYISLGADEYRHSVRKLLANDELLYNSLIDNIYAQGRVLDRKYRLIKFTYRFFMVGFSSVVLIYAFTLVFLG